MLSRIITESDSMVHYWFSDDDELDAALIPAGVAEHSPAGRYCFQTTYLNDCYHEYYGHQNEYRLIWAIRNPYSVIYSMMYNWGKSVLDDLFTTCGSAVFERQQNIKLNILKYTDIILAKNLQKADKLSKLKENIIRQMNKPIYQEALSRLLTR